MYAIKMGLEGFPVSKKDDEYPPHGWEITEKTDIFGIGLVALSLTWAHLGDSVADTVTEKAKQLAGLEVP
jgi:hypothetical protein